MDYIVAGCKPWSRITFDRDIKKLPGNWIFAASPSELDAAIKTSNPRFIFFLHWSFIVPEKITDNYECVCFHMTDVPFGRGGSPLQNLISRGLRTTKLTALRMDKGIDSGPVYGKKDMSLEGSTAEEIYLRSNKIAAAMIEDIIWGELIPRPQRGESITFKRRGPMDSKIGGQSLNAIHDHIRMLDADGYPNAYIEHDGFRYEFSRSSMYGNHIKADVRITPIKVGANV